MQQILLTSQDIQKIKFEKRLGYIISSILIALGLLFTFLYAVISSSTVKYPVLLIINVAIVLLAMLISFLINREYNKDLRANTKTLLKRKIESLRIDDVYEVGSGALYIPGLGDLFPKLWGQKMRQLKKYVAVVNKFEYELSEEIYNKLKEGDILIVHFSLVSATILQYEVDEQHSI
jgi:hypothetical protein